MIRVRVPGHEFSVQAFVFDKDGLMFESQRFWHELGDARMAQMRANGWGDFTDFWAETFGLRLDETGHTVYCDPKGILAVAAPTEEVSATAALYVQKHGVPWDEALTVARRVFAAADEEFDLKLALKPQKGFPEILQRLRKCGVPYGIATSDTEKRVQESLELFDDPGAIRFCVTSDMVAHGKPAPDMVFKAAEILNVPVSELVMIGDSFVDAEMAKRAGCYAIGVPETDEMRERMTAAGAFVIDDLDEIELLK